MAKQRQRPLFDKIREVLAELERLLNLEQKPAPVPVPVPVRVRKNRR